MLDGNDLGERLRSLIMERESVGEVNLQDLECALHNGDRVVAVVRHAERPPLEKNDPTFGFDLPITDAGKVKAGVFGFALGEFSKGYEHRIHSSRTRRCRMTAQAISVEMDGVSAWGFILDEILGGASPYFGSVEDRMALADKGDYLEALNEYFRTGHQSGFLGLAAATDVFEDYLWNGHPQLEAPLKVYVTHDINVGCFLAGRGVVTRFEDHTWPHYLDAAVAFLGRNGHARYGYLRTWESRNIFNC